MISIYVILIFCIVIVIIIIESLSIKFRKLSLHIIVATSGVLWHELLKCLFFFSTSLLLCLRCLLHFQLPPLAQDKMAVCCSSPFRSHPYPPFPTFCSYLLKNAAHIGPLSFFYNFFLYIKKGISHISFRVLPSFSLAL